MAVLLYESGAFLVHAKYIELRDNTWYFRRRIPNDVKHHYPGRSGLFFSLETSDKAEAAAKAHRIAGEQAALWRSIRAGEEVYGPDLKGAAHEVLRAFDLKPGQHVEYDRVGIDPDGFLDQLRYLSQDDDGRIVPDELPAHYKLAADLFYGKKLTPTLSDAKAKHFALGNGPRSDKALAQFNSAYDEFLALAGDLPVDRYTRENANTFVAALVKRGLKPATIKRYCAQIGPVFSTAIREFDLAAKNIFERIAIPNRDQAPEQRIPFSLAQLSAIQQKCREVDDQRRWALAVLSDTGARLAEVLGLKVEDVALDGPIPNIRIRPNSVRGLKTPGSKREVPLVGAALWGAQRAVSSAGGDFLFPAYVVEGQLHATTASNTLIKWLREQGLAEKRGQVVHSFRHSMRDRLRNVEAPSDLIDRIGGWSSAGVGESYGKGHSLEVMERYLSKAVKAVEQAGLAKPQGDPD